MRTSCYPFGRYCSCRRCLFCAPLASTSTTVRETGIPCPPFEDGDAATMRCEPFCKEVRLPYTSALPLEDRPSLAHHYCGTHSHVGIRSIHAREPQCTRAMYMQLGHTLTQATLRAPPAVSLYMRTLRLTFRSAWTGVFRRTLTFIVISVSARRASSALRGSTPASRAHAHAKTTPPPLSASPSARWRTRRLIATCASALAAHSVSVTPRPRTT